MTDEPGDNPRRKALPTAQTRRALLRLPLTALSTWVAARTVAGCGSQEDRLEPLPSPNAPNQNSQSGAMLSAPGGAAMPPPCAIPTTFAPIIDDGLRTVATRTDETTTLDWITMGISSAFYQATLPDTLLGLLRTLGRLRLGYPLDMLEHSLQTATRARRAGASDDLVLAGLFHHVGMTLSIEGYAELSAAIVRGYVSEHAYTIIRHHPEYAAAHHGPQSGEPADLRARFEGQPVHADAVRFADEWERLAYDPTYPSLPLSEFEPLVRERFTLLASDLYTTHRDCIRE